MSTVTKRIVTLTLALLLVISLAACGGNAPTSSGGAAPSAAPAGSTQPEDGSDVPASGGKVGVVYTMTGRGDMAFNDATYAGAMRAAEDFGLEVDHVEPKTLSEMEMAFEDMSASGEYQLIVGISFEVLDALLRTAPEYPEQKYALVDTSTDLDNVVSYIAKENEAAFLVGALAGLLNLEEYRPDMVGDANVIGIVGAIDADVVNRHIAGYTCGAKYVNPDIEVLSDYVGSFGDTATAQSISETMHNMGADIIYNAAAGGGLGIFKAAADSSFLAIGLDSNQNTIDPDHIVASSLKRVDEFVYSAIADVMNDEFKGGESFYLGVAENGVGYTTEGSNVAIDAKVIEIVEQLREKVASGEIEVPATIDEIDDWVANNRYEG